MYGKVFTENGILLIVLEERQPLSAKHKTKYTLIELIYQLDESTALYP
jgi:hypothetical protein